MARPASSPLDGSLRRRRRPRQRQVQRRRRRPRRRRGRFSMSNEIRILAVEDAANRGGLAKLLSGGPMSVVAEAGYGPEAVSAAQSTTPDVIVVSLEEPIARPLRT